MTAILRRLGTLACLLVSAAAMGQSQSSISFSHHLADYDAELRRPDGHVDTEAMVARLKDLGVNTYYWLVWHAPTDWDDLKLFLPKAAEANINVWVYLVPPTEGPPHGYPASEPFKMDYPRWGEEIARLSLQQTNLTGWVIDDFYGNRELFTPSYVRQMQARAKSINPALAFLPLMYFPEIKRQFVEAYNEVIDGVVVAYPQDREQIAEARAMLNDLLTVPPASFSCSWNTPTLAGDYVVASVPARVLTANTARLRFSDQDDFTGPTAGYHFKQMLIDGVVVWEEDVAGGAKGWHEVAVDVTAQTRGKTNVTVAFRLLDKKGVGNFGVNWRLKDLQAEGLAPTVALDKPQQWKLEQRGPFEAGFGPAIPKGEHRRRIHIPFIVMTAASTDEFRQRHGEPASPERIAEWVRMCLQAQRDGQCEGVVTYCLDKSKGSAAFPLVRKEFREGK